MKSIRKAFRFQSLLLVWLAMSTTACRTARMTDDVPVGTDTALGAQLHDILHRLDATGATVAAHFVDIESGEVIYATDASRKMVPAGNMKLFITAAALDFFGPAHVFETRLLMRDNDLWIIGCGDPALGDAVIARSYDRSPLTVFDRWAQALLDKGYRHIEGNLYYDDSALESRWTHSSWNPGDLTHWYAAPISGLNFNNNCVDITLTPTSDGAPAQVTIMPPIQHIRINNLTVTGSDEELKVVKASDADVYTITGGCIEPVALRSKPVTNPSTFFADAMRTHFAVKGVTIAGGTKSHMQWEDGKPVLNRTAPDPHEELIAVHQTKLTDLLRRINKPSQNMTAEGLCKMLARAHYAKQKLDVRGSWRHASVTMRDFLARNSLEKRDLELADGSGFSKDNRTTAQLITTLLVLMHGHQYGSIYRESLSIGGVDGTLAHRFTDMPNRIYAKTGFIESVRSLSGYIHTKEDRWVAFSIIYNDIPGDVLPYQSLQDEAVRLICQGQPGIELEPLVPTY